MTLPGTGVMKEATSLASLKSTSPTSLWPLFFVSSLMALIPQSITTAPGLIQSPEGREILIYISECWGDPIARRQEEKMPLEKPEESGP